MQTNLSISQSAQIASWCMLSQHLMMTADYQHSSSPIIRPCQAPPCGPIVKLQWLKDCAGKVSSLVLGMIPMKMYAAKHASRHDASNLHAIPGSWWHNRTVIAPGTCLHATIGSAFPNSERAQVVRCVPLVACRIHTATQSIQRACKRMATCYITGWSAHM